MIEPISIGATTHFNFLKAKLDGELKNLQTNGIAVSMAETTVGDINFIGYNINGRGPWSYSDEDISNIFRHYIANAVSEAIVTEWEEELLEEIILENYYYFNNDERRTIYDYAFRNLNNGCSTASEVELYKINRKVQILQKLQEYLALNNQLVVDGFIKFRLKEYVNQLEESVERAVDDFIMEREYKEFIRLLKYFVDAQEPRIDLVHVTMTVADAFLIRDKELKIIESDDLEGLMLDQQSSEINYEDLLVSALITLAPREVVLHFQDNGEYLNTVNTLKSVFGARVRLCQGCELCANE